MGIEGHLHRVIELSAAYGDDSLIEEELREALRACQISAMAALEIAEDMALDAREDDRYE